MIAIFSRLLQAKNPYIPNESSRNPTLDLGIAPACTTNHKNRFNTKTHHMLVQRLMTLRLEAFLCRVCFRRFSRIASRIAFFRSGVITCSLRYACCTQKQRDDRARGLLRWPWVPYCGTTCTLLGRPAYLMGVVRQCLPYQSAIRVWSGHHVCRIGTSSEHNLLSHSSGMGTVSYRRAMCTLCMGHMCLIGVSFSQILKNCLPPS